MSTQRFDIQHAPAPRESFRLLYISKSRFGGDWNSTTHTHSCTELFYCLSGEAFRLNSVCSTWGFTMTMSSGFTGNSCPAR